MKELTLQHILVPPATEPTKFHSLNPLIFNSYCHFHTLHKPPRTLQLRATLNSTGSVSSRTSRHKNPLNISSKRVKTQSKIEEIQEEEEENGIQFDTDAEDDYKEGDDTPSPSVLSLSDKPEWNTALLDDYETEEFDFATNNPNHRSGYVALVGKPNVGKSTLSNQIIGEKLSIVTEKPQTTRHRILGICSEADYQMILYDTPGIIDKKMHMLDSMMMKNVRNASIDADCVLIVVDACKAPEKIDELLEEEVGESRNKLPTLLVLNKKDLIKPGEIAKKLQWYEKFTNVDEVIPVSAKYGQGVDDVKEWILSKLPLGPAYYPKDITSEHPERFFVGEIVREKIFMQFHEDVPYACQVNAGF